MKVDVANVGGAAIFSKLQPLGKKEDSLKATILPWVFGDIYEQSKLSEPIHKQPVNGMHGHFVYSLGSDYCHVQLLMLRVYLRMCMCF